LPCSGDSVRAQFNFARHHPSAARLHGLTPPTGDCCFGVEYAELFAFTFVTLNFGLVVCNSSRFPLDSVHGGLFTMLCRLQ
jgi:hypothetical protein